MSTQKPKVLFILTSHSKLGNSDKPTGWYLPEFAHPWHVLHPYTDITVASPTGGEAPLDPGSVQAFKEDKVSTDFLNNQSDLWKKTVTIKSLLHHAKEYAAIFFVGGHGPMFDLVTDADSIALAEEFYESGLIVSAVCHGPAALLNLKVADGSYLIANQPVAGFTNEEEEQGGVTSLMPFLLEDELEKKSGGKYVKGAPWTAKVVVSDDKRLITGQNPQSATGVGEAIYESIFGKPYPK
ncbi:MAG: hypothetical protein M1838_005992 [Thelocarpon superellum]|nr:MAG: hypothetical protein M1838_005992 [Thelocarpon superellum]